MQKLATVEIQKQFRSSTDPKALQAEVLQPWIWQGNAMRSCRPPLFWKRKFEPQVIVTCVRWYLRFCLSLRDLEELMAERGLVVARPG